jgi:hypothetical protein
MLQSEWHLLKCVEVRRVLCIVMPSLQGAERMELMWIICQLLTVQYFRTLSV